MRFPIFFLVVLGLFACGDDPASSSNSGAAQPEANPAPEAGKNTPPAGDGAARVKIQHVLVGFQRAPGFSGRPVPPKALKRHQAAAEKLANEVYSRAKGGFDFTSLVKTYSDDQIQPGTTEPGAYVLVDGRPAGPGEAQRSDMVKGFGDVAFSLAVGAVGLAPFDRTASPFGWHIIKRIE